MYRERKKSMQSISPGPKICDRAHGQQTNNNSDSSPISPTKSEEKNYVNERLTLFNKKTCKSNKKVFSI